MVCITFLEHDGTQHPVDVKPGTTLMEAATWNRIAAIYGGCRGDGGCATCHVYLDRRWDPIAGTKSARERSTLRFAIKTDERSRLACFIKVTEETDGLTIQMPERQF